MNHIKIVRILDIPLASHTLLETVRILADWANEVPQRRVITANPEMVVAAYKDEELFHIIRTADLVTADGVGLRWAANLYSQKHIIPERVSGSDLLPEILTSAEKDSKKIYFLGPTYGVLEHVEFILKTKYPKLAYATSKRLNTDFERLSADSYHSLENNTLLNDITSFQPDIIFVAFGVPKQEKWIYWNVPKIPSVKIAMGIGGALDFFTGTIKRAPQFLQKLNLEWLWRLVRQPWRLPRIFNATIRFATLVIKSKIREMRGELRPNVVGVVIKNVGAGFTSAQLRVEASPTPTRDIEIFIAKRSDEENHWQFPQGGIEKGETPEHAVMRELREEIGLKQGRIISRSPQTHTYTWKTPHFLGYVGQKQSICYVEAIDNFIPKLNHDFVDYKWVSLDELLKWLHPVRHDVGKIVLQDLSNL